jgi:hypothetical protein
MLCDVKCPCSALEGYPVRNVSLCCGVCELWAARTRRGRGFGLQGSIRAVFTTQPEPTAVGVGCRPRGRQAEAVRRGAIVLSVFPAIWGARALLQHAAARAAWPRLGRRSALTIEGTSPPPRRFAGEPQRSTRRAVRSASRPFCSRWAAGGEPRATRELGRQARPHSQEPSAPAPEDTRPSFQNYRTSGGVEYSCWAARRPVRSAARSRTASAVDLDKPPLGQLACS